MTKFCKRRSEPGKTNEGVPVSRTIKRDLGIETGAMAEDVMKLE